MGVEDPFSQIQPQLKIRQTSLGGSLVIGLLKLSHDIVAATNSINVITAVYY